MSDDLHERLRLFAYNVDIPTFYDHDPDCVSEAADHIEALQASVAGLTHERDFHRQTADLHAEDIESLKAENERLRAGLLTAVDVLDGLCDDEINEELLPLLRAALEPKP